MSMVEQQLGKFSRESLQAIDAYHLDLSLTQNLLRERRGKSAIAIDIGGSSLTTALYLGADDPIQLTADVLVSERGEEYFDHLIGIADRIRGNSMSVGISCTGRIVGTRLDWTNNIPALKERLDQGDFLGVFPNAVVANDAVCGVIAAARESQKQFPKTKNVIVFINGSGIGASVFTDGQIWATELSPIEVVDEIKQELSEQLARVQNLSIRSVAANRAGIVARWFEETGERVSGIEIGKHYLNGDPRAIRLYDDSAWVSAHVIRGLGKAFNLFQSPEDTTIVLHGGIFQVKGYAEMIRDYLEDDLQSDPNILLGGYLERNICLEGAAILALTA